MGFMGKCFCSFNLVIFVGHDFLTWFLFCSGIAGGDEIDYAVFRGVMFYESTSNDDLLVELSRFVTRTLYDF